MNKKDSKQHIHSHEKDEQEHSDHKKHHHTIDEKQIETLQEQIDILQDKLLRSMAECENVRHRSTKLIEEAKEFSIANFAKDLVPVIDNLSKALEHAPKEQSDELKSIVDGIHMTKRELETVFGKYGLDCINPNPGEKFDYNIHNAISQMVTDQFEVGTIVATMQMGYKIKGRLLRPAAVVVAKK